MTANPDSALRQALDVTLTGLREILASAEQDSEAGVVETLRAAVAILSSSRQALVAAEKAIARLASDERFSDRDDFAGPTDELTARKAFAREAHALITEALQRGEKT